MQSTKGQSRRCLRCGHTWRQRGHGEPVMCQRCNRKDWNKKSVRRLSVRHKFPEYRPAVPNGPFDPLPGRKDSAYHLIIKAGLWPEVGFAAFEMLRESRPDLDWSRLVADVIAPRKVWEREEFGLWGKLVRATGDGEYRRKSWVVPSVALTPVNISRFLGGSV